MSMSSSTKSPLSRWAGEGRPGVIGDGSFIGGLIDGVKCGSLERVPLDIGEIPAEGGRLERGDPLVGAQLDVMGPFIGPVEAKRGAAG